jgi:hypothetical protein
MAARTYGSEMPTAKDRPVAGYIRVSRIGGRKGEGYISPDEQKGAIESYAGELGLRVAPDAWVDDHDRSGGNFDRPGWERIVKRIESGELAGGNLPPGRPLRAKLAGRGNADTAHR